MKFNRVYYFSYDKAGRLTGSVRYPAGATTPDNVFTEQGIASTQRVFDDTLK